MTVIIDEVLDTIREFAEVLTVLRPAGEVNTGGYVRRTASAVAGVNGHMQPMDDRDLRYVPEGLNTLEWWNIWSLQEIRVGDTVTDASGLVPVVTVRKRKLWKEGPFWHCQGTIVDDATALTPLYEGTGVATLPAMTGAGAGTFTPP